MALVGGVLFKSEQIWSIAERDGAIRDGLECVLNVEHVRRPARRWLQDRRASDDGWEALDDAELDWLAL